MYRREGTRPGLVLEPSESVLAEVVNGIAGSFVKAVCSSVRLLDHPELTEMYALYTDRSHMRSAEADAEAHVLVSMVNDSAEYNRLRRSLRRGVVQTYTEVEEAIGRKEHLLDIVAQHRAWDVEQVCADADA